VGHVTYMEEMRHVYKLLVRKPDRKRPLGRPRHRWSIILKWFLVEKGGKMWTGFIWPG